MRNRTVTARATRAPQELAARSEGEVAADLVEGERHLAEGLGHVESEQRIRPGEDPPTWAASVSAPTWVGMWVISTSFTRSSTAAARAPGSTVPSGCDGTTTTSGPPARCMRCSVE